MKVSFIIKSHLCEDDSTLVGGSSKNPYRVLKYVAREVIVDRVIYFDGAHSGREPYVATGIKMGVLKLYAKTLMQNLMSALPVFRAFLKSDVVQCHHPHYGLIAALFRGCLFRKVKFVVKAHGTAVPELQANQYRGIKGAVLKWNAFFHRLHDTFVLRQADLVLCSSEFQRREMSTIYGLPPTRTRCIYNGYDPDYLTTIARRRHQDQRAPLHIVFCGRVVPKKGVAYAIALFKRLAGTELSARLTLLLGRRDEIEDRATYSVIRSAAENDARIQVRHDLSESELYAQFGTASCGLVTSQNYESIPTVVIEMIACGLPVFATYSWGIPEILPAFFGLSGDLEEDSSKIWTFFHNCSHIDLASAVTKSVRDRFAYPVLVREYLAIYDELVFGKKTSAAETR